MSIGWFDAFRENGAPTWYGDNATPVRLDLGVAVLLWLFLTPTLAFCLILPGIRRLRALSAFCFLFSMAVGATLAVSIHYPGWHCGELRVFTAFRSHSRERLVASLGVHIGLTHVNITLSSNPLEQYYYEHFHRHQHNHQRLQHHRHQHRILQHRHNLHFATTVTAGQQQIVPPSAMALGGITTITTAGNPMMMVDSIVDTEEDIIGKLLFGTANYFVEDNNNNRNGTGQQTTAGIGVGNNNPNDYWTNGDDSLEEQMNQEEERGQLYYNERFDFNDVSGMEVSEVLKRGMPFPILRVVEYLSVDRTGFLWGKQYRLAGYYTLWALWLAFALWLLQMLLLCALPHRFGQVVLLCGLSTLFADAIYAWYTPSAGDLYLMFTGPDEAPHRLHFQLAACFYTTFTAGVASIALGSLLWLLEQRTSFRLKTFFSVYVDRWCQQQQQHRLSKKTSTALMAHLAGAAQPRRPIWWCPVPTTMMARNDGSSSPNGSNGVRCAGGGLSTPKGSFTSLSHPEQMVGWKRRHRTVHRVAKQWGGILGGNDGSGMATTAAARAESPIRAVAIELCSRPGMACHPCTAPGGGGGRSPSDSLHSCCSSSAGPGSSSGRSSGIHCHHHHHTHHYLPRHHHHHRLYDESQPSSAASTRPLDDDDELGGEQSPASASSPPTSSMAAYSPGGTNGGGNGCCTTSGTSSGNSSGSQGRNDVVAKEVPTLFWAYRHRERDKGGGFGKAGTATTTTTKCDYVHALDVDDGYSGEANV